MHITHASPAPNRPAASRASPLPPPRTVTRTRLEHGSITGRPLLRVVVVQLADTAAAPPTSGTRITGITGRGVALLLMLAAPAAIWPAPQPDLVTKMFRPPVAMR